MTKNNLTHKFYLSILALLVLMDLHAGEKNQLPTSAIAAPASIKIHPLANTLSKIGAFSCAERANQLGNFLTGNVEPELIIQIPKNSPNNRLLMSTMILPTPDNNNIFAGVSLAPNQINGCGGSYHTVYFLNGSCSKNISEKYKNINFQSINRTNSTIGIVNKALWIIAIPADKGCVFIKEEILE
jgi:hypothetical protein